MPEAPKRMTMQTLLGRLDQIRVANRRTEELLDRLHADLEADQAARRAKQAPPAAAADPKAKPSPPLRGAAARALRGAPEPGEPRRRGGTPGM